MTEFVKHTSLWAMTLLLASVLGANAYAEPLLNGMATYSHLGKDQFIAAVYCEEPTEDARELLLSPGPKTMELRVVADQIRARRFKRLWIESIAINSGTAELEKHAQNMADFTNLLRIKFRVGDSLRIEKHEASGVRILVDGHLLGSIEDPAFFDLLLRTWVGPVPLSTGFKNQLLAGGNVDEDQHRLFLATIPIPERITAVGQALGTLAATSGEPPETAPSGSETASTPRPDPAVSDAPPQPQPSEQPVVDAETDGLETPGTTAEAEDTETPNEVAQNTGEDVELSTEQNPVADATEPQQAEVAAVEDQEVPSGLVSEDELFDDDEIIEEGEADQITAETLLKRQLYISKLTRWTGGFVVYPRTALNRNQEGTVRLAVVINRNGKVLEVAYDQESEYRSLNKAAIKAIKKASPYPAIPDTIDGDQFVFTVPVTFRLNSR